MSKEVKSGVVLFILTAVVLLLVINFTTLKNITTSFETKYSKLQKEVQYNYSLFCKTKKNVFEFDKKVNNYIRQDQENQLSDKIEIIKKIEPLEIKLTEPNFVDIVAQSVKGVVHISCPEWQGSGFVIDKHIIVTARHVVEDVEDFEITTYDGKVYKAVRAISDKQHDVGFIWVEEELPNNMIAELGSIKDCKLGQDIFAIGSPYGKINFNSVTKGIISGLDRNLDLTDWDGNKYGWEVSFTTDSAGHPGNSGCPVFSMDGKVRGILVGGFSPVLIICMPVDIFLNDLDEIKELFIQDKYQFEKIPEQPYYNQEEDNEYY